MHYHVFVLASFLRFNPFISTEKYFVNTNLYRIPLKNCHATYLKLDFCQRPKVEWTNIYWSCSSRWIFVWISLSISISQIIKPYFINLLANYPSSILRRPLSRYWPCLAQNDETSWRPHLLHVRVQPREVKVVLAGGTEKLLSRVHHLHFRFWVKQVQITSQFGLFKLDRLWLQFLQWHKRKYFRGKMLYLKDYFGIHITR